MEEKFHIYLQAKWASLDAVRSLIVQRKGVISVNASGRSALMRVVFFSNRGIVKELIREGANVNGTGTHDLGSLSNQKCHKND